MKFRSIAQNLVVTFSRKSYLKICLLRMRKFIIHIMVSLYRRVTVGKIGLVKYPILYQGSYVKITLQDEGRTKEFPR